MFVRASVYIITIVFIFSGCVFSKQQLENKKRLNKMKSQVNAQQKISKSMSRRTDNIEKNNQESNKRIEVLEKENQGLLKRIEDLEKELIEITFAIYEVLKKKEHE
jgi:starvation-inducible outer membrane lipoprotein